MGDTVQSKVCSSCNETKESSEFHRRKDTKDGLQKYCKLCNNSQANRYYKNNKDKRLKQVKEHYYSNKHLYRAKSSKRRSSKFSATPEWLSQEQLDQIKDMYWLAQDLRRVTGEDYHVDHIIPLQGKEVRGLHVPWNLQILPADINLSKGNRLEDGSTEA
jgi:5-methylcytosine-specific restriction endonuclease McrA